MTEKDKILELSMKTNIMGKIAKIFINQIQVVILMIFLIIFVGIFGLLTLPKESLPEIVLPTISIQTLYPGASPEDVESLVTDKVENELSEFDDIDEVVSESSFGYSFVNLRFKEDIDINLKKLEITSKLREINFPKGVQQSEVSIFKTTEIPLMNLSISGDYSIFELTNIAEEIKNKLKDISGVEEVNVYGGLNREIHIIPNQLKMLKYNISIEDIKNSITATNVGFPAGEVDLNGSRFSIRIDEQLNSLEDIEKILVSTQTGKMVFVRDIAEVIDSSEEIKEYNKTYVNNEDKNVYKSVFLEIIREKNSDVIGTSENIKNYIIDNKGNLYPKDLQINIFNNLAEEVDKDLRNIEDSAVSGLIVVIIVLFLFIGFRESLIVSATIPLTLLGTIGVLNFFGITFNTFAVLGLIVALGLLVDNSVIVMENIYRFKKKGLNSKISAEVGTNQVGFPIFASTLTTLMAFLPLAILPGTLGDFVSTIPIVIMITITISFIISIVITPTISSRLLKNKKKNVKNKNKLELFVKVFSVFIVAILSYYAFSGSESSVILVITAVILFSTLMAVKQFSKKTNQESKLVNLYSTVLENILKKSYKKVMVLFLGVIVLLSSFGLFYIGALKVAFFPDNEPNGLSIIIDPPGGTTLEETTQIVSEVETELIKMNDIKLFNTTIGGNEIDKGTINVEFIDRSSMTKSGFEIVEEIETRMKQVPGTQIIVRGIASGPPVGKPLSIKIIGEDLEGANELSKKYVDILNNIDGVYNIEVSARKGVPQLYLDIKERKAQKLGLNVAGIAGQLRGQIEGIFATTIKDSREEIDVIIKKSEDSFNDITQIKNLYVSSNKGIMLPLTGIADFKEKEGISTIKHEDTKRTIIIDADLKQGFNINDVVLEFKEKSKNYSIPNGLEIKFGGDVEGIQENFFNLFKNMILAVFLIFIILTVQFKSIFQPFAILTTVPMALIGVLYGLTITGNDFGFYSFMALVAITGIAVNDAIVLIDYMNYLRGEGKNLLEAIKEACITRFNPVLATTMTTVCGVLPLAFKEVYYAQFSFALIFGLLATTILTLIFIPIVYSIIEGIKLKAANNNSARAEE